MKISIITACYNSVATLATAMESVLNQTYPDIEYIVVDGGSVDGTVEIAKEYISKFEAKSYKMKVLSEPDKGMYDAINKGIRMATGDVIGILNADDVLEDDQVIERVANTFLTTKNTKNPKIDVVYGDVRFVREAKSEKLKGKSEEGDGVALSTNELASLRKAKTLRYYSAKRWKPWMLQWGYMPPHPGVYIRRECFERLGYYKTDYHIAADYELLIRYLRKGKLNMSYLDACIAGMRPGGKSTKSWRSNLLLNQEIVRGNRENGYFCCLPMLVPKYFFKIWEFILIPRQGAAVPKLLK
jgi:glycosyltransferase involved in cell wall biosynthesis